MRKVLAALFITIITAFVPFLSKAQNGFEVVDYSWTDAILFNNNYVFQNKLDDTTEIDDPIIWIKMKCNGQFLSEIDSADNLPFRFKWISKGLVDIPKIRDPISEKDKTDNFTLLKNRYQKSINDKGFFELVVWSAYRRDNMKSGLWQVKFLYSNNKPVKCNSDDCIFEIYKK